MAAMTPLPVKLHSAAEVRELDRRAIEEEGIPGYSLMQRAGEAAFAVLRDMWGGQGRLLVVCGAGNNAGDGYVVARIARGHGHDVTVVALVAPAKLTGDAAQAYADFEESGGTVVGWDPALLRDAAVVADAILGTGLDRELTGRFREAVAAINDSGVPVLALDIPSGLHADSGAVMGVAVRASHTVTFVGLKVGFYVGAGPDHVGTLHFDGLGVPRQVHAQVPARAQRLRRKQFADLLVPRKRSAHKGDHGRVLIVGGGPGMPGAARLAGEAALRCGAGLVTIATHHEHSAAIAAGRPELICRGVSCAADLSPLLRQADMVALGPGLGQSEWAHTVFEAVLELAPRIVIDADGLNLLAAAPRRDDRWILTPHPGEAGRLLGVTTASVQQDRIASACAIAEKFGGVSVLKGAGTLITDGSDPINLCDRGNPGMATAGMGDVLTGVIAALAARIDDCSRAAALGVLAHACAGDIAAARGGELGLIAGDLMEPLREWLNRRD